MATGELAIVTLPPAREAVSALVPAPTTTAKVATPEADKEADSERCGPVNLMTDPAVGKVETGSPALTRTVTVTVEPTTAVDGAEMVAVKFAAGVTT